MSTQTQKIETLEECVARFGRCYDLISAEFERVFKVQLIRYWLNNGRKRGLGLDYLRFCKDVVGRKKRGRYDIAALDKFGFDACPLIMAAVHGRAGLPRIDTIEALYPNGRLSFMSNDKGERGFRRADGVVEWWQLDSRGGSINAPYGWWYLQPPQ